MVFNVSNRELPTTMGWLKTTANAFVPFVLPTSLLAMIGVAKAATPNEFHVAIKADRDWGKSGRGVLKAFNRCITSERSMTEMFVDGAGANSMSGYDGSASLIGTTRAADALIQVNQTKIEGATCRATQWRMISGLKGSEVNLAVEGLDPDSPFCARVGAALDNAYQTCKSRAHWQNIRLYLIFGGGAALLVGLGALLKKCGAEEGCDNCGMKLARCAVPDPDEPSCSERVTNFFKRVFCCGGKKENEFVELEEEGV